MGPIIRVSKDFYISVANLESFQILVDGVVLTTTSGQLRKLEGEDRDAFLHWLYEVLPTQTVIDLGAQYSKRNVLYALEMEAGVVPV